MADFRFSPEAETLRVQIVDWLGQLDRATLTSHADPGDLTGLTEAFERSLHAEAGERGWLNLPAELQAVVNFEAARADAPVVDTAMTLIGGAVTRFAVNDHHRQVLADMAVGRVEGCVAYTEPEAGTDLAAMHGRATRAADGWVLNGTKSLLTGAHKADWCVTVLRTEPDGPPRDALSMFLVDLRGPGIKIRRRATLNGWTLGEIEFEGALVGAEALLGTEGAGWRQMSTSLGAERAGTFWLGFARHVLDLLGRYVCRTSRDGGVLADDPLVLDEIGRLEAAWASADLLSRRALWSQIHDTDVAAATAMAKIVTTELLQEIAQAATEIAEAEGTVWAPLFSGDHLPGAAAGGRFAWEYLERIHATIGAGVNEVHRDGIAATLLGEADAMNLASTDRELDLARDAAAALTIGEPPPVATSFTETCIVAREAGRVAPDRRFVLQAWAELLGWAGDSDVTVAFDPAEGHADHVPRGAAASTAIVAHRSGWVAELDLGSVERIAQPTLDDPDAARVVFTAAALRDRRDQDVVAAVQLALILLAADCTGAAEAALDAAIAHVRERRVFGGVVADLQVVRHRCADMATAVTRCWDLVLDTADAVDRGDDPAVISLKAAHAKVFVAEHARRVTEDALRTVGGRGILADQPWSRWYRRVKGAEPMLGSPRVHRATVARASLARWR